MKRLFRANVTEILKGAGMMKIALHRGNTYTVDIIPGVKENALLAVVKEPSASEIDMVMRMIDYKKLIAEPEGPAEPDLVPEPDHYDDEYPTDEWDGCSQPEW